MAGVVLGILVLFIQYATLNQSQGISDTILVSHVIHGPQGITLLHAFHSFSMATHTIQGIELSSYRFVNCFNSFKTSILQLLYVGCSDLTITKCLRPILLVIKALGFVKIDCTHLPQMSIAFFLVVGQIGRLTRRTAIILCFASTTTSSTRLITTRIRTMIHPS